MVKDCLLSKTGNKVRIHAVTILSQQCIEVQAMIIRQGMKEKSVHSLQRKKDNHLCLQMIILTTQKIEIYKSKKKRKKQKL